MVLESTNESFVKWLLERVQRKGWTQAEFSRRSGVSTAMVSLVLGGERHPGVDFCSGVAAAFDDVSPEDVMRLAGLLPPHGDSVHMVRRVSELMSYLPYDECKRILDFVEWRYREWNERNESQSDNTRD